MAEAVLIVGIVILALASAWTGFKALSLVINAKDRNNLGEGFAYLFAFAIVSVFAWFLTLQLP